RQARRTRYGGPQRTVRRLQYAAAPPRRVARGAGPPRPARHLHLARGAVSAGSPHLRARRALRTRFRLPVPREAAHLPLPPAASARARRDHRPLRRHRRFGEVLMLGPPHLSLGRHWRFVLVSLAFGSFSAQVLHRSAERLQPRYDEVAYLA